MKRLCICILLPFIFAACATKYNIGWEMQSYYSPGGHIVPAEIINLYPEGKIYTLTRELYFNNPDIYVGKYEKNQNILLFYELGKIDFQDSVNYIGASSNGYSSTASYVGYFENKRRILTMCYGIKYSEYNDSVKIENLHNDSSVTRVKMFPIQMEVNLRY